MLLLDDPITIYPDVYTHLMPVKMEIDIRSGMLTFYYAPVRITGSVVYLGVEEKNSEGTIFRHPRLVKTIEIIQNLSQPDPVIQSMIQEFITCAEYIDTYLADNFSFQEATIQLGTAVWSLANTFEAIGSRILTHELNDIRNPPFAQGIYDFTVDPTVEIT